VSVRRAATGDGEVPEALKTYVKKVREYAYKVMDEDIEDLRQAGYSEDQIFELTVSIALGAASNRLKMARAALDGR
jgi:alkylhydroperoxidase family enzyme